MDKKRIKQLDTICRNLLVCSQRTIDEVLRYLEEDEKKYVINGMEELKKENGTNND